MSAALRLSRQLDRRSGSACTGWTSLARWGGWAALGLSIAVYAALGLAAHQPFHEGARALRYFDLRIYRLAARRVVHGTPLYGTSMLRGLGFTYPPFAALVILPLAWVPLRVDELAVTGINVVGLVWLLRRTLLIGSDRSPGGASPAPRRAQAWSLAALAAAAALWLEPVSVTLGYGQINLLIAALVVFDLSRPDSARSKGAAIGLAAAIKLTPLLFLAYLLLSGRRRAAGLGAGVFAASIAFAYAALDRDASAYWGGRFLHVSQVGNAADPANQSLHGAIARLDPSGHLGADWQLAIGATALIGLALAVHASRRGDQAAGFSLATLSTLIASPISWTHHWTLTVPVLLLLARRAYERRSWRLGGGAVACVLLGYAYLPERAEGRPPHAGLAPLLTSNPYILAAAVALAITAAGARRGCAPAGLALRSWPPRQIPSRETEPVWLTEQ